MTDTYGAWKAKTQKWIPFVRTVPNLEIVECPHCAEDRVEQVWFEPETSEYYGTVECGCTMWPSKIATTPHLICSDWLWGTTIEVYPAVEKIVYK